MECWGHLGLGGVTEVGELDFAWQSSSVVGWVVAFGPAVVDFVVVAVAFDSFVAAVVVAFGSSAVAGSGS